MLYIRYDKPIMQGRTKYSAFISFPYSDFYRNEIKKLPVRSWHPDKKEWEIPTSSIDRLFDFESDIREINQLPYDEQKLLGDFHFKTKPFKHQLEGLEYGISHNNWLLGDQQGLGKTKQIIDLAVWKKQNEGLKHCLIICGINNLKYNWLQEIGIHSDEDACILGKRFVKEKQEPSMKDRLRDIASCPKEFFWITNIETLRCHKEGKFWKSEIVDLINAHAHNGELGLVVVDEVHKAKNPSSAQGRGLLKIKGVNKIGLSGTLMVNNPMDLFMPLTFIDVLNYSIYIFKEKFTKVNIFGSIVGFKNMEELRQIIDCSMLRRTKDLLDLPPKIIQPVLLEMSKEERRLYNEIRTATAYECDKISNPTLVLPKLLRLRQVCCHTGLVSSKVNKSSKFEYLHEILNEAKMNNEKVIVFSMFRELIEMAMEEFKEYNPLHIWGQMNQMELQDQINTFQNDSGSRVIFGVIQAAGTGITLNTASHVVFLDLPWNKATMEQAEDRAHRIGTKKTVIVHILLMKDTYDSTLYNKVIEKGVVADALVDGKINSNFKEFLHELFKKGD